jgi:hypothetical protein
MWCRSTKQRRAARRRREKYAWPKWSAKFNQILKDVFVPGMIETIMYQDNPFLSMMRKYTRENPHVV